MPLPITIPNTFATATSAIPLSQLDTNFSTVSTAINSMGNGAYSLSNVSITGGVISNTAVSVTSLNGGPIAGFRNRIINGNFQFNQRGFVSGTASGAGTYTFDRWKTAGASTTVTFTAGVPDTTITISTGSTGALLQQVIEDVNVEGGNYVLSWTGTATARVGINGGAPSGSYSGSPLSFSGATAGQAITVEFYNGTLSKVQLEPSSGGATPFERRMYGTELQLCQRYYQVLSAGLRADAYATTGGSVTLSVTFPQMRAAPTVSGGAYSSSTNISTGPFTTAFQNGLTTGGNAASTGMCMFILAAVNLSAEL